MFRCRLLKVATPFTAGVLTVLAAVKALGPVALTLTVALLAATLPNWSTTSTTTAGLMAAVAVVVVGCWPKARWLAVVARLVRLNEAGVATPVAAAVTA